MDKSEPRLNSTIITYDNKVYELKAGTIGTYKSISSLIIQF